MFGIMGIDSAFVNAAGRGGKKKEDGEMLKFVKGESGDIKKLSCIGEIKIVSIYNGEKVTETYSDLTDSVVSVQADQDTEITIYGSVTKFVPFYQGSGMRLNSIDPTKATSLVYLDIMYSAMVESIDLSNNIALEYLDVNNTGIGDLDLSNNVNLKTLIAYAGFYSINMSHCTLLTSISIQNNNQLKTIYYPATNDTVSTKVAAAITAANAADGTVYTDSAGAYYSTIADAATAKGWTIQPLS